VIASKHRKQGLARKMLKDYLISVKISGLVDRVMLLSKATLISFYLSVGFTVERLSAVVHGQVYYYFMMH